MELLIIFVTILVCTGDFVDFISTAEPEAKRRSGDRYCIVTKRYICGTIGCTKIHNIVHTWQSAIHYIYIVGVRDIITSKHEGMKG